eukprot:Platyproteum_vivax@DN3884_c0_g1_i1.p1
MKEPKCTPSKLNENLENTENETVLELYGSLITADEFVRRADLNLVGWLCKTFTTTIQRPAGMVCKVDGFSKTPESFMMDFAPASEKTNTRDVGDFTEPTQVDAEMLCCVVENSQVKAGRSGKLHAGWSYISGLVAVVLFHPYIDHLLYIFFRYISSVIAAYVRKWTQSPPPAPPDESLCVEWHPSLECFAEVLDGAVVVHAFGPQTEVLSEVLFPPTPVCVLPPSPTASSIPSRASLSRARVLAWRPHCGGCLAVGVGFTDTNVGEVQLWQRKSVDFLKNLATSRIWQCIGSHKVARPASCIVWSPNGRRFAAAVEFQILIWEACRACCVNEPPQTVVETGYACTSVCWSPDGSCLACVGGDGIVGMWHVTVSTCIADGVSINTNAKRKKSALPTSSSSKCQVCWRSMEKELWVVNAQNNLVSLKWKSMMAASSPVVSVCVTPLSLCCDETQDKAKEKEDTGGSIKLLKIDGASSARLAVVFVDKPDEVCVFNCIEDQLKYLGTIVGPPTFTVKGLHFAPQFIAGSLLVVVWEKNGVYKTRTYPMVFVSQRIIALHNCPLDILCQGDEKTMWQSKARSEKEEVKEEAFGHSFKGLLTPTTSSPLGSLPLWSAGNSGKLY